MKMPVTIKLFESTVDSEILENIVSQKEFSLNQIQNAINKIDIDGIMEEFGFERENSGAYIIEGERYMGCVGIGGCVVRDENNEEFYRISILETSDMIEEFLH